jgi:hypothetical protein
LETWFSNIKFLIHQKELLMEGNSPKRKACSTMDLASQNFICLWLYQICYHMWQVGIRSLVMLRSILCCGHHYSGATLWPLSYISRTLLKSNLNNLNRNALHCMQCIQKKRFSAILILWIMWIILFKKENSRVQLQIFF